MDEIVISKLSHTWLIDVDGTVLKHNGYQYGTDQLLEGVVDFWQKIPEQDTIILMSARTEEQKEMTLEFFKAKGLRWHQAIFGLPTGERILFNDAKPSGLKMAVAINVTRDEGLGALSLVINPAL